MHRLLVAAVAACLLLPVTSSAAEPPVIHAHRGGSILDGTPAFPEETMPAFRNTVRYPGTWLEMDAVVSKDGVPFVIHDSTLDRTTNCSGNVGDKTAAEISPCRADVLGTANRTKPAPPDQQVPLPRLSEALAFAKETGFAVNLEIKYLPGDPGYVPGDRRFADRVMDVVIAARLDPAKLIVQSFEPNNLEVAKDRLPGVRLSYLTLEPTNESGPQFAASRGYEWISPGGVPSAAYVQRSKSLGLKVVPYTLNTATQVQDAAKAGVDAVITDDVPMARRALGLPAEPDAGAPQPGADGPAASGPGPELRGRGALFTARVRLRRRAHPVVSLNLSAPGRVHLRARDRRGRLLATVAIRFSRRATRTVAVRITARGRRALRAGRTLRLIGSATATDGAKVALAVAVPPRRR